MAELTELKELEAALEDLRVEVGLSHLRLDTDLEAMRVDRPFDAFAVFAAVQGRLCEGRFEPELLESVSSVGELLEFLLVRNGRMTTRGRHG